MSDPSEKNKLKEQIKQLQSQVEEIEKKEKEDELEKNSLFLFILRKNKDFVLSLFEHSRSSCSDENPCNGYHFDEQHARCEKCHLIEILNDEFNNDFEVMLSVNIVKIV